METPTPHSWGKAEPEGVSIPRAGRSTLSLWEGIELVLMSQFFSGWLHREERLWKESLRQAEVAEPFWVASGKRGSGDNWGNRDFNFAGGLWNRSEWVLEARMSAWSWQFSIWVVASFTPGDAVPIVEAHVCIDVINHSEAWHQSLSLLEQLPRWEVGYDLSGESQLNATLGL